VQIVTDLAVLVPHPAGHASPEVAAEEVQLMCDTWSRKREQRSAAAGL
jgi:hypothetical protein